MRQEQAQQLEEEVSEIEAMRSQVAKQKVNSLLVKKREVEQLE